MADGSMLIKSLAIILLLGVLFTGIAGSFASEDDLNESWITKAGIDDVFGVGVDLFKFPISAVTIVIDFFDGEFWEWITFSQEINESKIYANITGTGTNEDVTLDGTYVFYNNIPSENIVELVHEEDTSWLSKKRKTHIYYDDTGLTGANISAPRFIGRELIYSSTSITETDVDYILNLTFDKVTSDYNWSNTSEGQVIAGAEFRENESHSGYKTNAEQVFNFFDDKIKPNVKEGVRSFGLLPEVIGIPIFILLLVSVVYAIIKLFPWT